MIRRKTKEPVEKKSRVSYVDMKLWTAKKPQDATVQIFLP
jgi:hypothetical protein